MSLSAFIFWFVQLVTRCLWNKGEWGKKPSGILALLFIFSLFNFNSPVSLPPFLTFLLSSCVAFLTQGQAQCLKGHDIGTVRALADEQQQWNSAGLA